MHSLRTIRSVKDIRSIKPILTASRFSKNSKYFIDKAYEPIYEGTEIVGYKSEELEYIRVGLDTYLPLNMIVISDVIDKNTENPTENPTEVPGLDHEDQDNMDYVPDCIDHSHDIDRSIYHDIWIKTTKYGVYDPYLYWYQSKIQPTDAPTEKPTTIYDGYDTIVAGNILVVTEGGLVPLLTSADSKLMDIHYLNENAINYRIASIYIKWLGFDNLLNHDITEDGIVSKFIEDDQLKFIYGNEPTQGQRNKNNVIKNNDIPIEVTHDSWNHDLIDDTYSHQRLPKKHYHTEVIIGEGLIDSDITSLIKQLDAIDASINIGNRISTLESRGYRQVVDYGDINDYISIQSLVDINESVHSLIEGGKDKIRFRNNDIHCNQIASLGNPIQSDPYLYQNIAKNYSISKIIHEHDMLELVILCKMADQQRSPILWNKVEVISDRSYDKLDPILYYRYFKSDFYKLNWNHDPIRMDGYHITSGYLAEYSFSINIEVVDSLIKIDNYFLVDISTESINVFPINSDISEYYIKSCKLLNINDN